MIEVTENARPPIKKGSDCFVRFMLKDNGRTYSKVIGLAGKHDVADVTEEDLQMARDEVTPMIRKLVGDADIYFKKRP